MSARSAFARSDDVAPARQDGHVGRRAVGGAAEQQLAVARAFDGEAAAGEADQFVGRLTFERNRRHVRPIRVCTASTSPSTLVTNSSLVCSKSSSLSLGTLTTSKWRCSAVLLMPLQARRSGRSGWPLRVMDSRPWPAICGLVVAARSAGAMTVLPSMLPVGPIASSAGRPVATAISRPPPRGGSSPTSFGRPGLSGLDDGVARQRLLARQCVVHHRLRVGLAEIDPRGLQLDRFGQPRRVDRCIGQPG